MTTKEKTGIAYVLSLAGKNRLLLYVSAPFAVLSGLCAVVPYLMVYRTFLCLFDGGRGLAEAPRYGIIAAIAIVLKFLFQIVSLSFSTSGPLIPCTRCAGKSAVILPGWGWVFLRTAKPTTPWAK